MAYCFLFIAIGLLLMLMQCQTASRRWQIHNYSYKYNDNHNTPKANQSHAIIQLAKWRHKLSSLRPYYMTYLEGPTIIYTPFPTLSPPLSVDNVSVNWLMVECRSI